MQPPHLPMVFGEIFDCHNDGRDVPLSFSLKKPDMVNSLRGVRQSNTTKNYPTQNAHSDLIKKLTLFIFDFPFG